MEDRALASTRWADDGDLLALAHLKRYAVERRHIGARRIGEAHVFERDLAARWRRQRKRMRRPRDRGRNGEDLEQPLGGAGGGRDLAAGFRQRAERAAGQHGVENELAERSGRDLVAAHLQGADPQHHDDAGGDEKNDQADQHRPRADRVAGGFEGALDRAAKPRDAEPLVGEGLQHAHRADQFGRIGRCVGECILRRARAAAHGAGEGVERQHDRRNCHGDIGRRAAGSSSPSWRWRRETAGHCAARSRPTSRRWL